MKRLLSHLLTLYIQNRNLTLKHKKKRLNMVSAQELQGGGHEEHGGAQEHRGGAAVGYP